MTDDTTKAPPVAPHITLEIVEANGTIPIGSLSVDEPLGSMSSHHPDGRRVYVFGWNGDGVLGVWESKMGFDTENHAVRDIATLGLMLLSDLTEPYELDLYRDGHPVHKLRITHRP